MRISQPLRSAFTRFSIPFESSPSSSLNYSWKVRSSLRMVSTALKAKHLKQSKKAPYLIFWAFCLLYIVLQLIYRKQLTLQIMNSLSHTFYAAKCPNHARTAASWADIDERNYLASLNYQLVNEINDTLTEKQFYQTKLSHQFRNHNDQLQQAFRIISEKNAEIISLQEQLDFSHKDLRAAADDYIALKKNAAAEKEMMAAQMANDRAVFQEKLVKMEQEFEQKCELKIRKRVQEVENQCEDRIKMFTGQIQLLTENAKRLKHQLSMLQEDYRQMLLKNDTIIQESIHRQLRKRDFQAQNNYLRDLAQYQTIKTERNQLKQQLNQQIGSKKELESERTHLRALVEVHTQRIKDLQQLLESNKQRQKEVLFQKYPQSCEAETNTDKQFVPIAMPIDLNLMSEVVSLREFLIQKIVLRFLEFYQKAGGAEKKTSKSLLTFNNYLSELKKDCGDLRILLFLHGSIQKIVKVYCPSLNSHSKEFLTVKDEFLRKSLIECQAISNNSQRLLRLLDTLFRVKNPLNHLKTELSAGELKLLEMKLLISLKKNIC